jgi:hypothetical protein
MLPGKPSRRGATLHQQNRTPPPSIGGEQTLDIKGLDWGLDLLKDGPLSPLHWLEGRRWGATGARNLEAAAAAASRHPAPGVPPVSPGRWRGGRFDLFSACTGEQ